MAHGLHLDEVCGILQASNNIATSADTFRCVQQVNRDNLNKMLQ